MSASLVGSEMCIRDSGRTHRATQRRPPPPACGPRRWGRCPPSPRPGGGTRAHPPPERPRRRLAPVWHHR
eukprot:806362-Alexandrium_andersonii.AAC.1